MSNNQLAMVMIFAGGFLFGGVATLLLRWWRGKMPKKETYADFICWSLTEEPRAWVANEFRVLNASRKINLWVANGAAFIRDESNPSSFSYREKRRIWRAVKRNSHLRTMLPVDVEAAETEPEAPEPPKPIPYASAIGSRPEAPWVTREEFERLSETVSAFHAQARERILALEDAALGAAQSCGLPDGVRVWKGINSGARYVSDGVRVWESINSGARYVSDGYAFWLRLNAWSDGVMGGYEKFGDSALFVELHGHERDEVVRDWQNRAKS